METIIITMENSKTSEPNKFALNYIYYTWKNIKKQYKNNKPKIIAPIWNDEFELADGSYSMSDI